MLCYAMLWVSIYARNLRFSLCILLLLSCLLCVFIFLFVQGLYDSLAPDIPSCPISRSGLDVSFVMLMEGGLCWFGLGWLLVYCYTDIDTDADMLEPWRCLEGEEFCVCVCVCVCVSAGGARGFGSGSLLLLACSRCGGCSVLLACLQRLLEHHHSTRQPNDCFSLSWCILAISRYVLLPLHSLTPLSPLPLFLATNIITLNQPLPQLLPQRAPPHLPQHAFPLP